jgi:hypothetical protein
VMLLLEWGGGGLLPLGTCPALFGGDVGFDVCVCAGGGGGGTQIHTYMHTFAIGEIATLRLGLICPGLNKCHAFVFPTQAVSVRVLSVCSWV